MTEIIEEYQGDFPKKKKMKYIIATSGFGIVCLLDLLLIDLYFYLTFWVGGKLGFIESDITILEWYRKISYNQSLAFGALLQAVSLLTIIIALRYIIKFDIKSLFTGSNATLKSYAKTFPVVMLVNTTASFIVGIITMIVMNTYGKEIPTSNLEISSLSPKSVAVYFIVVAVSAPIIEEILYRGILLGLLKPFNKTVAVFASAFIFAIAHGNLEQAVGTFIIGLLFGYVTIKFNSIIPAMILHSLNNLTSCILSIADVYNSTFITSIAYSIYSLILILGFYFVLRYAKKFTFKTDDNEISLKKGYFGFFLNIFVIAYIAYTFYIAVQDFINLNK